MSYLRKPEKFGFGSGFGDFRVIAHSTHVYIAATPAISRIIAQHSTFLDVDIVKYAFSSMTLVVDFEGAEVTWT